MFKFTVKEGLTGNRPVEKGTKEGQTSSRPVKESKREFYW
jgi:hypothetical protein